MTYLKIIVTIMVSKNFPCKNYGVYSVVQMSTCTVVYVHLDLQRILMVACILINALKCRVHYFSQQVHYYILAYNLKVLS